MDVLRMAGKPLSARQIGEVIANLKGIEVKGVKEWNTFLKPILGAARRFQQKGTIKLAGGECPGNTAMLWELS